MKKKEPSKTQTIREGWGAPYPSSAPTELDAVSTFQFLLDKIYIKGEVKSLDKNPNGDGVLEFTRADQIPLGKFEVQVKTLDPKNYKNPKFQCEKDFLSHCYRTNLPVILIAVNVKNVLAYWLHIDREVLDDAERRIKKGSLVMTFPAGNVIGKDELAYIPKWERIVLDDVAVRQEAHQRDERHRKIESELAEIRTKLGPPLLLNNREIRALQIFLDAFNGLLEREFLAIKQVSYPDYWKIGVGMIKNEREVLTFFMLPIPYGNTEGIIRQLEDVNPFEDTSYFFKYQALMMLSRQTETLERLPLEQSYNLLSSEIKRIIKKHRFALPDEFLAKEFVSSFITTFPVFLGFVPGQTTCSLEELQLLTTTLLPVAIEAGFSFVAEGITQMDHSFDNERDRRPHPHYQQRIVAAREKLQGGYIPVVSIRLTSQLFPIPLLLYYINYLQSIGHTDAVPVYEGGQNRMNNARLLPSGWNKPVLFENLRRFFGNFPRIYLAYIKAHFPYFQTELTMFDNCQMVVFLVLTTGPSAERPHMLCYRMQHESSQGFQSRFYLDTDPDNPIDNQRWGIHRDPRCTVDGADFTIISSTGMPIKFMFESSPTYALIHDELEKRMEILLRKRSGR